MSSRWRPVKLSSSKDFQVFHHSSQWFKTWTHFQSYEDAVCFPRPFNIFERLDDLHLHAHILQPWLRSRSSILDWMIGVPFAVWISMVYNSQLCDHLLQRPSELAYRSMIQDGCRINCKPLWNLSTKVLKSIICKASHILIWWFISWTIQDDSSILHDS